MSGCRINRLVYDDKKHDYLNDYKFISTIGKIKVVDDYGVDVSNNVVLFKHSEFPNQKDYWVFFKDSKNQLKSDFINMTISSDYENYMSDPDYIWDYVNEENGVAIFGTFNNETINILKLK